VTYSKQNSNVGSPLSSNLNKKNSGSGPKLKSVKPKSSISLYLHPDLDTWVIFPWTAGQGKVARLICDVFKTDGVSTYLILQYVRNLRLMIRQTSFRYLKLFLIDLLVLVKVKLHV
jgi:hypothetical protein